MRSSAAALFLAVLVTGAATADHASTHGMLVFGKSHVFLSHLPLFHTPHDYQVLLRARLGTDAEGRDAEAVYLEDRKATDTVLYTLEPEPFVLPDQVKARKAFRATLYRGHFERGGTPIARGVRVSIESVLHFRRLARGGKPDPGAYLAFGTPEETYLAHYLLGPPDFDQIVRLTPESDLAPARPSIAQPVRLAVSGALANGQKVKAGKRSGQVESVVYTEHDELKE
jgi:hypothetical protein